MDGGVGGAATRQHALDLVESRYVVSILQSVSGEPPLDLWLTWNETTRTQRQTSQP